MSLPPHEIATQLLRAMRDGTTAAADDLLPIVYEELRRIAARLLQAERAGHTLEPTALIHEAYIRLVQDGADAWQGRLHFTRVAARAMRNVLVDHARGRLADKRGGGRLRVTLDTQLSVLADDAEQVVAVHEGLERLAAIDPSLAQIVELRFFAAMTTEEIASVLGVSTRTVERGWRLARAWWLIELGEASPGGPPAA